LTRLVNTVPDWNKLLRVIVEFPREIIPLSGSALVIYDHESGQYETAEIWGFHCREVPISFLTKSNQVCTVCQAHRSASTLYICNCEIPPESSETLIQYCLPLNHAGKQEALLYLFVTPEAQLTKDQETLLNSLAPEMTLALVAARNIQTAQKLREKTDTERQQIARDLHDNIAQSLIYLRNKLDMLTDERPPSADKIDIQPDLQHMREVTDEVYISLRTLLKEIEGKTLVDLNKMLLDYLQTLKPRVGFDIQFVTHGEPHPLHMRSTRQVLNIIGELLNNVEKHAGAERVVVELESSQAGLTITVCDDGKGFESLVFAPDGHMGLSIIRERAEELNGRLEIKSRPESGTQAELWLPLNFA